MVPAAVEALVLLVVEVDEVDQQLIAVRAGEAGRVPAGLSANPLSEDGHLALIQGQLALLTDLHAVYSAQETVCEIAIS